MPTDLTCFGAYDVRSEVGIHFNPDICYRIGRAFAKVLKAKRVVIGFDARATSPFLSASLSRGLIDEGVTVLNIGLAGTEEVYWATTEFKACGGLEVTASHNPVNFNGIKMVKSGSQPLESEAELDLVKKMAEENSFGNIQTGGLQIQIAEKARKAYISKLLAFIEPSVFQPLKILINSGNGAAGPTLDALIGQLALRTDKLTFVPMFHKPDHSFPNGIPNPLLPENRAPTRKRVLACKADIGIAFDGDFDRCFFFDERGNFVPSEYIVGLLAEISLQQRPGARIIHDLRSIWNVQDSVMKNGGIAVGSRTGHNFIKQAMRAHNAIYGGDMSAHHYFRDFSYCDSGMIPWLLIIELMSRSGQKLSVLVEERMKKFPVSGEINLIPGETLAPGEILVNFNMIRAGLLKRYRNEIIAKDERDGLSLSFENWRLNIRLSNTEAMIRLNIESKADRNLIQEKLDEIKRLIPGPGS